MSIQRKEEVLKEDVKKKSDGSTLKMEMERDYFNGGMEERW